MFSKLPRIVTLWILATGVSAQPLSNSSFEAPGTQGAGAMDWVVTKGTLTLDQGKKKGGQFSGKIDGGNGPSSAYQDVSVLPGNRYTLSGFWRNGDRTAAFDVARVSIKWLSGPGGQELGDAGTLDSGEVVSEWTPFKLGPVEVPAGTTAARIRLSATFNTAAFDELDFGQTADAPVQVQAAVKPVQPVSTPAAAASAVPVAAGRATATPQLGLTWVTDLGLGYRTAAQTGRKVLLFVASETDSNSRYFLQTLFADPGIQGTLAKNYVCIRLDLPAQSALAEKLKLSTPGVIVLYDAKGTAVEMINEQVSITAFETLLAKH